MNLQLLKRQFKLNRLKKEMIVEDENIDISKEEKRAIAKANRLSLETFTFGSGSISQLAKILEAIYEVDFMDISYGLRPGRSCLKVINEDSFRKK